MGYHMQCRHCGADVALPFIDLGTAPPSNAYLTEQQLAEPEKWFPLKVMVCEVCWLVQTRDYAGAEELFDKDYAYFSSFSSSWLAHADRYVSAMVDRFGLVAESLVVEVAANDGYLLQHVKRRGIQCLGIEPTASTAAAARAKGLTIIEEFFGVALARRLVEHGTAADLLVANNVLAHVPQINDFVAGFRLLLKPEGVATFEFPHLVQLVGKTLFDTIYHEHYSYLSFTAVERILAKAGLSVFDVEELPTHGGSLRVFAQRDDTGGREVNARVGQMLMDERAAGVCSRSFYEGFQTKVNAIKDEFLAFLLDCRKRGKTVVGYGAAAKGNTLINYAGIRGDLLHYVADRNPAKKGKYLPGCRIPIADEDRIRADKPDYVIILPWNLREEIVSQLSYVTRWGGRLVTAVPDIQFCSER
jgi:SAM-dependent methyltransferase